MLYRSINRIIMLSVLGFGLWTIGFVGCGPTTSPEGGNQEVSKDAGPNQDKDLTDTTTTTEPKPDVVNQPDTALSDASGSDNSAVEKDPPKETDPPKDAGSPTDTPPGDAGTPDVTKPECKHDCDCHAKGMVCGTRGKCSTIQRASACKSCTGSCQAGQPCYKSDNTIGTCAAPIPCKHDCDCLKVGMVCAGTCQPLKRASQCGPCSSTTCKKGEPCYNKDQSIGTCTGGGVDSPCKHDCDCVPYGLLCNTDKCAALRRISYCLMCSDPNCKKGDPCQQTATTFGTCVGASKSCKDDCDCDPKQACINSSCQVASRTNQCASCSDKTCPRNTRCRKADGTLSICCCTLSGCGTGQVCCSGGAPPPPNTCAQFCTAPDPKTNRCPLFP